jgi:DNA-binding response OmpR family regulator
MSGAEFRSFRTGQFGGTMRRKILLIDDSPAVHDLVRASLAEEPAIMYSAYEGTEGISLAREWRPELILLDVDMPGADGFEVCRRLSADVQTADIPIIFLTASADSRKKVMGLDLGGSDYITKPFNPAEFSARIRASLRAKTRIDAMRSKRVNDFIQRALQPASSERCQ